MNGEQLKQQIQLIKVLMEQGRKMDMSIEHELEEFKRVTPAAVEYQNKLDAINDIIRRKTIKIGNIGMQGKVAISYILLDIQKYQEEIGNLQVGDPRRARDFDILSEIQAIAEALGIDPDRVQVMNL